MGHKISNGDVFGSLKVKKFLGSTIHGHCVYKCECTCGRTINVRGWELVQKKRTHCGCQRPSGDGRKYKDVKVDKPLRMYKKSTSSNKFSSVRTRTAKVTKAVKAKRNTTPTIKRKSLLSRLTEAWKVLVS